MSAPKFDWDRLLTTAEWAESLKKIMVSASSAVETSNHADISALQELLRTYIKRSPAKVQFLDEIAAGLLDDLMSVDFDESIKSIKNRNAELQQQIDVIKGVTADAKADAAALRLEPVIDQINKAKVALEKLKHDFEQSNDTNNGWYTKADTALTGIKEFLK